MARALVTGGQGFIGGHLCRALLERGDEVVVLDLPEAPGRALSLHGIAGEVELVEGDVADRRAVDRAITGAESVFHLAAQTLVGPAAEDPEGTFRSNVEGTWTLLEACRSAGVDRVVVASSDKAYGPSDSLPYREGDELRPAAPYEGSKAAADVISRSYWNSWGLPVAVTRLANVYGGGDLNFFPPDPGAGHRLPGRPGTEDPLRRITATGFPPRLGCGRGLPRDRRLAAGRRRRGLQRGHRHATVCQRSDRGGQGGDRLGSRTGLPFGPQPRRRDRQPVRGRDEADRHDRLAPQDRLCRRDSRSGGVVRRLPRVRSRMKRPGRRPLFRDSDRWRGLG